MKLPEKAKEIAAVLGVERALFLIGKLPRIYQRDARYPAAEREKVLLYVPKTLKPDHQLVKIIGWHDAMKLVHAFGGEILDLENCKSLYRKHRDAGIIRMIGDGVPISMLADWFGLNERTIRNVIRENPPVAPLAANDNNRTLSNSRSNHNERSKRNRSTSI